MQTAHRLTQFPEYIFSRLNRELKDLESQTGQKVLNLAQGSPDVPPSPIYIDQLKTFLDQPGSFMYPGYKAIPQLEQAIINWHQRKYDTTLTPDQLCPLLGAKDAVAHLPLTLLNPGDELLIPDPGYPAYESSALMYGATPVHYQLMPVGHQDLIDLDQLTSLITPNTRAIWLCFPANPSGHTATLDQLTPIVDFCRKHKLWILYDHAYAEITFDGYTSPSILQIPQAQDITIELHSFSKTFSFAGYRMGWAVGSSKLIAALSKIKSQIDSGMTLPLQLLGAYALDHQDLDWHQHMLQTYDDRRHQLLEFANQLGMTTNLPQGSLYLWAKIPDAYSDSEAYVQHLLHDQHLLLAPGTAYGPSGKDYVRLACCTNLSKLSKYL